MTISENMSQEMKQFLDLFWRLRAQNIRCSTFIFPVCRKIEGLKSGLLLGAVRLQRTLFAMHGQIKLGVLFSVNNKWHWKLHKSWGHANWKSRSVIPEWPSPLACSVSCLIANFLGNINFNPAFPVNTKIVLGFNWNEFDSSHFQFFSLFIKNCCLLAIRTCMKVRSRLDISYFQTLPPWSNDPPDGRSLPGEDTTAVGQVSHDEDK